MFIAARSKKKKTKNKNTASSTFYLHKPNRLIPFGVEVLFFSTSLFENKRGRDDRFWHSPSRRRGEPAVWIVSKSKRISISGGLRLFSSKPTCTGCPHRWTHAESPASIVAYRILIFLLIFDKVKVDTNGRVTMLRCRIIPLNFARL